MWFNNLLSDGLKSQDMCNFSFSSYTCDEMVVDHIYSWKYSGLFTKE